MCCPCDFLRIALRLPYRNRQSNPQATQSARSRPGCRGGRSDRVRSMNPVRRSRRRSCDRNQETTVQHRVLPDPKPDVAAAIDVKGDLSTLRTILAVAGAASLPGASRAASASSSRRCRRDRPERRRIAGRRLPAGRWTGTLLNMATATETPIGPPSGRLPSRRSPNARRSRRGRRAAWGCFKPAGAHDDAEEIGAVPAPILIAACKLRQVGAAVAAEPRVLSRGGFIDRGGGHLRTDEVAR
jgi:hypothetical protein